MYLITPDEKRPTHIRKSNGQKVRIKELPAKYSTNGETAENLDNFTPITPPPPPAPTAASIEADYQAALRRGITLPMGDDTITLAAAEADQNAFTRLLTLLREAGAVDGAAVSIADQYGTTHALTYAAVKELLVAYGLAIQQAWAEKAQRIAAL